MVVLLSCIALLIFGYFTYARLVDRIFAPDLQRETVAIASPDGVDAIPLPTWKVFFIQLLDIAGIGPIFGPILGALYGPYALLWIVLGSILAGGVHDYFSGMLSVRHQGGSLPEVIGEFMGRSTRIVMRIFSVLLLLLVGVVFVLSPAKLMTALTGMNTLVLVCVIFAYYFLATILPIDRLIGRLYPLFGVLLLCMTFGVLGGLIMSDHAVLPNLSFSLDQHPGGLPMWPLLFITLSCGAISGFHSTQSPIMARCIRSEKNGRLVFYGAMVTEGIIALIWATVGMSFYESPEALNAVIAEGTPALVVSQACRGLLGPVGAVLAILGVIVLPITSGDTAFRATRLILAETFKVNQARPVKRLMIAVPLFLVAIVISTHDFNLIWRYFGWSNQTLASLMLWAAAIYLSQTHKPHWIASLPATFMTAVVIAFILQSDIGFGVSPALANMTGGVGALLVLGTFLIRHHKRKGL
jgi:carbon starvation protein CstA